MLLQAVILLFITSGGEAYHLAEPAVYKTVKRETYQGGWPLFVSDACPKDFSVQCGNDDNNVAKHCCPTGNTCFGNYSPYCCPTTQDCTSHVTTLPTCADPTSNMFIGRLGGFFCCKQGLVGIYPSDASGFCQDADQVVPVSLLATMTSQIGGSSVTPFGGFGTATDVSSATNTGAGTVTSRTAAGASPTTLSTSTTTAGAGGSSSTSSSSSSSSKGWNPGNGAIAGLAIAAAFLLGLIWIIWSRCSKRRARREALRSDVLNPNYYESSPYNRPSSQVHQYVPPPTGPPPPVSPLYSPVGSPAPRYDPVSERFSSPSPAYKAVDAHELGGRVNVAEVPAVGGRQEGDTGGRVEIG